MSYLTEMDGLRTRNQVERQHQLRSLFGLPPLRIKLPRHKMTKEERALANRMRRIYIPSKTHATPTRSYGPG